MFLPNFQRGIFYPLLISFVLFIGILSNYFHKILPNISSAICSWKSFLTEVIAFIANDNTFVWDSFITQVSSRFVGDFTTTYLERWLKKINKWNAHTGGFFAFVEQAAYQQRTTNHDIGVGLVMPIATPSVGRRCSPVLIQRLYSRSEYTDAPSSLLLCSVCRIAGRAVVCRAMGGEASNDSLWATVLDARSAVWCE